jgi:hypothetical protein
VTTQVEWTTEEFELLLANFAASDEGAAAVIQTRGPGAVAAVRAGVHAHHQGKPASQLSRMMVTRLEARPRAFKCGLCSASI